VAHAIELLTQEVSRDMAMLGINTLDELSAQRHLLAQGQPRPA
jgi:isopentenyl diphosphate isomerase/L-lactate dehydrogenase-like FMN-dependent dehydrogenase